MKKRKPYRGSQRNVDDKIKRFKNAVGKILVSKGYRGLGINKVSFEAGISKNLMYRYFGTYRNLIEQVGDDVDFWLTLSIPERMSDEQEIAFFSNVLTRLFDHLIANPEMQRLIMWELQEANYNTATLLKKREKIGEEFFKTIGDKFGDKVDFRAVCAILVAAVYHLAAFSSVQKVTFCGIDLSQESGRQRIFNTLEMILESAYSRKGKRNNLSM